MSTQRAQDIYVSLLLPQGHGYPLWLPEPHSNLPSAYTSRGIQIGDVGILDDNGGFTYLFNVCKDASDPVNQNRVPPRFSPLQNIPGPNVPEEPELFERNFVISSSAVERLAGNDSSVEEPTALGVISGFEFNSSTAGAAVLVLPDGGERYDSKHPHLFKEYAVSNARSWYQYFNGPEQARKIRNGALFLVTGCDKCRSWGSACHSRYTESEDASFKFLNTGDAELNNTLRYNWEIQADSSVHQRSHERDVTSGAVANQTVFLRGFSVSVRPLLKPATAVLIDKESSQPPGTGPAPYVWGELGPTIRRLLDILRTKNAGRKRNERGLTIRRVLGFLRAKNVERGNNASGRSLKDSKLLHLENGASMMDNSMTGQIN